MQKGIRLTVATVLFLGLVLLIFGCSSQQNKGGMDAGKGGIDLTGTWYMQVDTSRGSGNPTLDIKQEKADLSGTYNGVFGTYPIKGNIDGDKFVVGFKTSEMEIKYIGVVNGNSMEGEVDFGGQGKGKFVGER